MRKNQTFPLFGVGFAVVPRLLGKGKDRGKNTSDRIARTNCSKECRDWPAVIGQSQLEMNPARCWHTFGGRRIEIPGGEHRRPPTLGALVLEVLFWQAFWAFLALLAFWPQISKKSFQNPSKSSLGASKIEPGASKIEPGAFQDAIF